MKKQNKTKQTVILLGFFHSAMQTEVFLQYLSLIVYHDTKRKHEKLCKSYSHSA